MAMQGSMVIVRVNTYLFSEYILGVAIELLEGDLNMGSTSINSLSILSVAYHMRLVLLYSAGAQSMICDLLNFQCMPSNSVSKKHV